MLFVPCCPGKMLRQKTTIRVNKWTITAAPSPSICALFDRVSCYLQMGCIIIPQKPLEFTIPPPCISKQINPGKFNGKKKRCFGTSFEWLLPNSGSCAIKFPISYPSNSRKWGWAHPPSPSTLMINSPQHTPDAWCALYPEKVLRTVLDEKHLQI